MEKTFNILIEETKRNIVAVINNANLPIYVINCILKDLYNETDTAYRNSYIQEQRDYDLFLQEMAKQEMAKQEMANLEDTDETTVEK